MTNRKQTDNCCWVCVTQHGFLRRRKIELFFYEDLPELLRETREKSATTLIYCRHFATMVDGLGHLTILRSLSCRELGDVIRQVNPEMGDLSEQLIEDEVVAAFANVSFPCQQ